MDLVLRHLDHGGVPVLSLAGEVDLATVPRLRDALVQAGHDHPGQRVVVDLDGVAFLDSTGLGVLVGGLRRIGAAGGDLLLVCSTPRLLDLLTQCRLDGCSRSMPAGRRRRRRAIVADDEHDEPDERDELAKPDELRRPLRGHHRAVRDAAALVRRARRGDARPDRDRLGRARDGRPGDDRGAGDAQAAGPPPGRHAGRAHHDRRGRS